MANVELGRRTFLAGAGMFAAAVSAGTAKDAPKPEKNPLVYPDRPIRAELSREYTMVVLGAGGRGNVYSRYGKLFPGTVKVVGVADLIPFRRNQMTKNWNIPAERRFNDYRDCLKAGKLADIALVTLPDALHYDAVLKALDLGYDVLVEKPMAQSAQECLEMLAKQRETKRIVGVGHVLRYAPYYVAIKSAIDRGLLGDLLCIQHAELVEKYHMSHSFVRGNWRNSKESTPMIISKCCHDLDIMRWFIGKPCKTVSAEGKLSFFVPANRPKGAPANCFAGCPYVDSCIFAAQKMYVRNGYMGHHLDLVRGEPADVRIAKVKNSPYSRCVFACDNDVPDHYAATLGFEGGVTVAFSYEGLGTRGARITRIMGTKGTLEGDGQEFRLTDLVTGRVLTWNMKVQEVVDRSHGHGGGDLRLFRDFLMAVDKHDESLLTSSLAASVDSHVIGYACEKSRLEGIKVRL